MGFSRQEYWSGLPFPSLGDLPDTGWNSGLLHCRQILYQLSHQGSPLNIYAYLISVVVPTGSLEWLICSVHLLSCVQLFVTAWNAAHRAPLSMEFARQEYWSRLPFLTPGDLPDPGIKLLSPMFPALAGGFFTTVPRRIV